MQRASTIIIQTNRAGVPQPTYLAINPKTTTTTTTTSPQQQQPHQTITTPSKMSQKSGYSTKTNYLKKAHTLVGHNVTMSRSHLHRARIPVSNSMKNLEKIKVFMSSNSLSTIGAAAAVADSSGNVKSAVAAAPHIGCSRQDFFKRMFRNQHSSSVESPTASNAPPTASTNQVQAANSPTAATAAVVTVSTSKSPKMFFRQHTKPVWIIFKSLSLLK